MVAWKDTPSVGVRVRNGSRAGPFGGDFWFWAQFLRKSAPTGPAKSRKCVEIYNADILFPIGITNVANMQLLHKCSHAGAVSV